MRLLAPLLVVSVQSPRKNQLNDSLYSQTWLGTHQTASEVASTSYCSRCAQDRALFKQMTKQNIKEEKEMEKEIAKEEVGAVIPL